MYGGGKNTQKVLVGLKDSVTRGNKRKRNINYSTSHLALSDRHKIRE